MPPDQTPLGMAHHWHSYSTDNSQPPYSKISSYATEMEVRKADGTHYSPDSLQCLVAGLQRYLRENLGRAAPNIVDKQNNLVLKREMP